MRIGIQQKLLLQFTGSFGRYFTMEEKSLSWKNTQFFVDISLSSPWLPVDDFICHPERKTHVLSFLAFLSFLTSRKSLRVIQFEGQMFPRCSERNRLHFETEVIDIKRHFQWKIFFTGSLARYLWLVTRGFDFIWQVLTLILQGDGIFWVLLHGTSAFLTRFVTGIATNFGNFQVLSLRKFVRSVIFS